MKDQSGGPAAAKGRLILFAASFRSGTRFMHLVTDLQQLMLHVYTLRAGFM